MGYGGMTRACRVFLCRNQLYPGYVSGALYKAQPRTRRDGRRRLQLQGRWGGCPLSGGDASTDAFIEYHPASGNVLLKVRRERFWYREHGSGLADLILFGVSIPHSTCLGIVPDAMRLSQLMDFTRDWFYLADDPLVRRVRRSTRSGHGALVVTLVPVWTYANWSYSDGGEVWYE